MLSPETLAHLGAMTCPGCQKPLGCWHCYPVTDPATLISQLTEHAPHCLECAEHITEDLIASTVQPKPFGGPGLTGKEPYTAEFDLRHSNIQTIPASGIAVIYKVKAAPRSASGRLVRLEKDDPGTSFIHLFSPAEVRFNLVTSNAAAVPSSATPPATRPTNGSNPPSSSTAATPRPAATRKTRSPTSSPAS